MRGRDLFVIVQRLLVAVVLASSGGYLLVYLYRWEWNRALISGLVFVAAEVALVASLLLRRISTNGQPSASFDLALARVRQAGIERRRPFAWLVERDDLGVFIPVLLGAGVVLSALAYVIERIAEATAHVTVDRHLARRLALLAPARPSAAPVALIRWTRAPRRAGPLAALVAVAVITALVVHAVADATQSRVDASDRPVTTVIELVVEQRTKEPVSDTAAALWIACRPVLPGSDRPVVRISVDGNHALLTLAPGIRRLATRRLTGCLADATLSSVRAEVLEVHHASLPSSG